MDTDVALSIETLSLGEKFTLLRFMEILTEDDEDSINAEKDARRGDAAGDA